MSTIKQKLIQVRGSGGGKGGGGDTYEADDNMYARQSASFIDAIAEGPIKGLVYGDASILVDEVRLRDVNQATGKITAEPNFTNFKMVTANGAANQGVDDAFFGSYPSASFLKDVGGAELLVGEPQYQTISSGTFEKAQTDYIKVTISTTGMSKVIKKGDNKGDIHGTAVYFSIHFHWIDIDGVAHNQPIFNTGFTGKVSGKYAHTFGFNIENFKGTAGTYNGMTDWSVRVERSASSPKSPDDNSYMIQNAIYIDSIEASIADKLSYPYTAYVGGVIDAEQFSNIPARGYEIDGKEIQIPKNHWPIDYNGRKLTLSDASDFAVGDSLSQTISISSIAATEIKVAEDEAENGEETEQGYLATGTCAVAHGMTTGDTFTCTIGTDATQDQDFYEGTFVCSVTSATQFTYKLNQPWDETANSGAGGFKTLTSTNCTGTITAAMFSNGLVDKKVGNVLYVRNVAASTSVVNGVITNGDGDSDTVTATEQVLIPANYRRNQSTGAMETLEQAWAGEFYNSWCNNPAWVYYDLIVNKIYGLGNYLDKTQVNKWELFQIARYCDELVPAGVEAADLLSIHTTNDTNYTPSGDTTKQYEPRFSANLVIAGKQEAYKVLNDVTSIFRGMTYWLNGEAYVVQDSEKDPVYQFTNANVIDGKFAYEGTANKTRTNSIIVNWNNPQDYYRARQEIVELEESLQKDNEFLKPEETTAFGCTSRGQARRLGKWKLLTNNWNTNTVSFSTSLNASFLRPGDIVQVIDQAKKGKSWGGRVSTGSSTTAINIDRKPTGFADGTGTDGAETGYSVADYKVSCSFVGYKATLAQDTATINVAGTNTSFVRGQEISAWRNSGGTDITIDTEEKSKQILDTSNDLVFVQWTPFHYTETQTLNQVSNSGKTLTVASAFSSAPTNESIWVVSRASLATGKTKEEAELFRIMSIAETAPNNFEITGLEYNATKFDAVDKNEALSQDRVYYMPDSFKAVPAVTNILATPKLVAGLQQNSFINQLDIEWDPPKNSDGTYYSMIRGYDVEMSVDNLIWNDLGMTTKTSLEIEGVLSGTYYVKVYTVNLNGRRSPVALSGALTVDFAQAVAPGEEIHGLKAQGNITADFELDTSTGIVTFTPVNFYHNDGNNEHAVTGQGQLDFSNLSYNASPSATQTLQEVDTGYIVFDHSASKFVAKGHNSDPAIDQFFTLGSAEFSTATGTIATDPTDIAKKWTGLDSTNFDGELARGNTFKVTHSKSGSSTDYYHKVARFVSDTEMYSHEPSAYKLVDGDNQAFSKPAFLVDYENDTIMGKVQKTGSSTYTLQKYGASKGEDAFEVHATNENFTFNANTSGVVSNESDFTCDFTVKKGTQTYTYASSGTTQNTFGISLQARSGFDNDDDIVISGSGQITIGDGDMDAYTAATATMRLVDRGRANTVIADRVLSFTKTSVGADGSTGAGANFVFARAASKPNVPTADGLNIPSADIQWYDNPPSGTDLLWASKGTVAAGGTAYTWGTVFQVEGAAVAELKCYSDVQASNGSSPTKPSGSTYNATTSTLTLNDSNWNTAPPAVASDGDSIYQCTALVSGASTATALAVTWTDPVLYQRKTDGATGRKVAELTLYYALDFTSTNSFTAPSTPSTGTYNFLNATVASIPSGWSQTRPEVGPGKWIYQSETLATESSTDNTSNALTWGTPSRADLPFGDINWVFQRSASQPTSVGTTNWPAVPTNWYDDIGDVPSGSDEIWASKGVTTFVNTSGTFTYVTTWQDGVQIEGSTGATGPEGDASKTVYYLKTSSPYSIPSTPSGDITATSGNNTWRTDFPGAPSAGQAVWQSIGNKPSGGSWTWGNPTIWFDKDRLEDFFEGEHSWNFGGTGLAKFGLTNGDYANANIQDTDLYGSGKVWANLPASGANNYSLPSGVLTGASISGTTLTFSTGAGNVNLTTQDTNTTYANLAALDATASTKLAGIATGANNYSLPGDVLKGTISVSGQTVTIPKANGTTYTITTQDTNTTYSAGDFDITQLDGYSAAAYANANLGWTVVSITVGEVNTTWTHNGTAYDPTASTQTVTLAITHPSFGTSSVVGTWTRTNKTISGFSLGSGSGATQDNNWAFGDTNTDAGSQDNAFGSATADHGIKTIYVQHTDSNTILEIFAQVLNTNFSVKCLTPAMLPENLQIGDEIDSPQGKTKVIDMQYKEREGYWILEDELEITNDHPILIDGEWILAEEYAGKKEYIDEPTEVVYVETENELLTVKGWTVGGKY